MMKDSFVVDDTKVVGSLAGKVENSNLKHISSGTDKPEVLSSPSNNLHYASNKNPNPGKKDSPVTNLNNNNNTVIQQPIANNTINHSIDTLSSQENPLAIINLNQDKIAANYYNENDEEFSEAKNKSLTTRDYVTKKITEAAWGEDDEIVSQKNEKKKLKGFDVLALIGKGLKKLGNNKSDAKKIELEEGKGTEYIVTIGGVSVTRRAAN